MSSLQPVSNAELATLQGRTILVTGGASGIGRALVLIAHSFGANLGILDVDDAGGRLLAAELKERATFIHADVSDWGSVLNAFETVHKAFGSIDVVYANAGVHGFETLLDEEFDESGRLLAPSMKSIDINLGGVLLTTRAAVHFFTKQGGGKNYQLVFTGSAASLIDTPPLYNYCAAKAGVLGLMRGLRSKLPEKGISVNMIAPWMTVTPMLPDWIRELWGDLPANNADGVANALLIPAVRPDMNGRTLWVAGNNAVELERALHDTQPQWIGQDLSAALDEGQSRMGIAQVF